MRPWIDGWCHRLKLEPGAAAALIAELEARGAASAKARAGAGREGADVSSEPGRGGRLDYAGLAAQNVPIGSGVTEAACKVLVEQRLGGSGMRWKEAGAAAVLSLRCLT